jgi:hypothetical protein
MIMMLLQSRQFTHNQAFADDAAWLETSPRIVAAKQVAPDDHG